MLRAALLTRTRFAMNGTGWGHTDCVPQIHTKVSGDGIVDRATLAKMEAALGKAGADQRGVVVEFGYDVKSSCWRPKCVSGRAGGAASSAVQGTCLLLTRDEPRIGVVTHSCGPTNRRLTTSQWRGTQWR